MKFVPGNAQHIGARETQQDSFGFSDPNDAAFVEHGGLLAVIADGMGGMAQGDLASRTAVTRFLDVYMSKGQVESVPRALLRAINEANGAVLSVGRENGLQDEMGTTLVAAVVHGSSLYWISAGDSRLYLVREGHATQLTIDHVYANELDKLVARGEMSRAEAAEHPERDHLTSYLGNFELTEIDRCVTPFPLQPGDRLILCSDGLYKGVEDGEIAAVASSQSSDSDSIAERLVNTVLDRSYPRQDNVTVLTLSDPESQTTASDGGESRDVRPQPVISTVTISVIALVLVLAGAALWWFKPFAGKASNQDQGARQKIQPPQTLDTRQPEEKSNSSQPPSVTVEPQPQNPAADPHSPNNDNHAKSSGPKGAPGTDKTSEIHEERFSYAPQLTRDPSLSQPATALRVIQ